LSGILHRESYAANEYIQVSPYGQWCRGAYRVFKDGWRVRSCVSSKIKSGSGGEESATQVI